MKEVSETLEFVYIGTTNVSTEPEDDPKKRVKPCEVFDVIARTSTGGYVLETWFVLGLLDMLISLHPDHHYARRTCELKSLYCFIS